MRTSSILNWVLIVALIAGLADTAEAARKRKRRAKAKPKAALRIKQRIDFDWLNGVSLRSPADSTYNPGNSVFETETYGARTDLNVDYRASIGARHKIVVRPRAYAQYFDIGMQDPPRRVRRQRGKVDLTESFWESWLNGTLSMTFGLQNFQWGPAELISPSNPLVHFNREQRSLLWREKGRVQARLNWAPSRQWSHVLLAEPIGNGDLVFVADREFSPKAMFKSEYRSAREARDYVGISGGTEEGASPFAGAYFNYALTEGLSLYSDFRFTWNPYVYMPSEELPGVVEMSEKEGLSTLHLGVYGVRYESESYDVRLEAIVSPAGYSQAEWRSALQSTSPLNPFAAANFRRVLRPGFEMPGRAYGYLSVRLPDLGDEGLWQLSLRYLHSGLDGSGSLGWSVERGLGDHFVLASEGRFNVGERDGELTIQERFYAFLGVRALW